MTETDEKSSRAFTEFQEWMNFRVAFSALYCSNFPLSSVLRPLPSVAPAQPSTPHSVARSSSETSP